VSGTPHQIGPYTIDAEIGRGGMGVVYRATDTRLDRTVAVKALPEHLAEDPERLARFEREAKTLASLNHPNVAGIHGVEEHEGRRYLVLEFVEGQTLAELLDRGPLPIDEAIEVCAEIAAGVEAAHDAGVIHRDLKPGNIIITPEGRAKVLDFGLARVDDGASSSSGAMSMSPTLTSPVQHSPTVPGMIMGTAAYMSPEQARGRAVDRRTDIWSFGVVLYECLTGASPFVGETVSDSIGAILHKQLDFDRLPPQTPRALRRVLERCVVRDKQHRYRDIGDVRLDLLRARDESVDAPPPPATASGRSFRWVVAPALVAAALVAGWFAAGLTEPDTPRTIAKFDLVRDTADARIGAVDPKISPDGRHIAYEMGGAIHVREIDSFTSRTLPGVTDAAGVFWSPDSAWLGYRTRTAIFKVPIAGGAPTRLTSGDAANNNLVGGAWLPDGRIIYGAGDTDNRNALVQVSSLGGESTVFLAADPETMVDFHDVVAVPGTNTVIFVRHKRDLAYSIEVYDGRRSAVIADEVGPTLESPAYAPTGHVLYARRADESAVWARPFDLATMRITGEPILVELEAWGPSVSQTGDLLLRRGAGPEATTVVWVGRDGAITPLEADFDFIFGPMPAFNDDRIAFAAGDDSQRFDIWVHDPERGLNQRITFEEGMIAPMAWSADGREICAVLFNPSEEPPFETKFFFADGSGESRPSRQAMIGSLNREWTMATAIYSLGAEPLHVVPIDDPADRGEVIVEKASTASPWVASISPDGTLLAYASTESGRSQVYCKRFPSGEGKWQVSTRGGENPHWSADGATLYFRLPGDAQEIHEVTVEREPALRFGQPTMVLDASTAGLDLDGGWRPDTRSDRILTVKLDNADRPLTSLAIIQNWAAMLEQR
jgi:Tol biopolymer transport system component/predicted Ser/Thr protein kinase